MIDLHDSKKVYDAETEERIAFLEAQYNENPEAFNALLHSLSEEDVQLFAISQIRKVDKLIDRLDKVRADLHETQKELYLYDLELTDLYLYGLERGAYTPEDKEVLEFIKIEDLPLSVESIELLTSLRVKNLVDLYEMSLWELLLNPNITVSCLEEIVLLCERYHLY